MTRIVALLAWAFWTADLRALPTGIASMSPTGSASCSKKDALDRSGNCRLPLVWLIGILSEAVGIEVVLIGMSAA